MQQQLDVSSTPQPIPIPGSAPRKTLHGLFDGVKDRFSHRRHKSTDSLSGKDSSDSSTGSIASNSAASQSGSTVDDLDSHITDWATRGFETIPDKPGYRLASLWSTPGNSLYSLRRASASDLVLCNSANSSSSSLIDFDHYGRFIPALVSFRLEWRGPIPIKQSVFDLNAISPALLQEGDYNINLKWLSDTSGEFLSLAATKDLAVRNKSHVFAKA